MTVSDLKKKKSQGFPFISFVRNSRSVSNQKALLDSGTMGTKGHTEIIVPSLTESYNSHVRLPVHSPLHDLLIGHQLLCMHV